MRELLMQTDPVLSAAASRSDFVKTIDVSQVGNSIQALRAVEEYLAAHVQRGDTVDVRIGQLLLTRGVLSKIGMLLKKYAVRPGTVYSSVPQTQQAALDEGFSVREKPLINSPLSFDVGRTSVPSFATDGVDLPGFHPGRKPQTRLPGERAAAPASNGLPPSLAADETYVEKAMQRMMDILPPAPEPLSIPLPQAEAHGRAGAKSELSYDVDSVFRQVTENVRTTQSHSYEADIPPSVTLDDLDNTLAVDLPATQESPTLFLKQTLRSGQVLRFNGSVVVIGDAHAGSEIAASGDIVVWGELRGIAHAGVGGNDHAEIRAMKIDALQLRIADTIARRPDRIYYHKPSASELLAPEVAKVADGEIRIFKESV